ncbi:MAG: DUF4364 family protein [Clostridia bacterium]|nr:DUF4364 family protein [Clostridia bacterium]
MENDASSAGVNLGGLFGIAEIKILICYIFTTINEPIPANMLANLLHYEGIANGFEVSDAIVSLVRSGHLVLHNKAEDTYMITENGVNVAKTLQTSLSYTVKDRACAAAIKMLSRFKNAKDTEIKTVKENGASYVVCSLLDGEKPFMSIKVMVTDEDQAHVIKESFLQDPAAIYKKLIEMLTK